MFTIYPPKRLCEIDMINLAAGDKNAFITWCEESYNDRINHAAATILAGGFKVVMLTGPSACGKTTSAMKLANRLRQLGTQSRIISLDNFFRSFEDYPTLPDGSKDYESIETIDIAELTKCLEELMNTGETLLPIFDFVNCRRREEREHFVINDGIVIVEGIHALNPGITPHFEAKMFKIYLSMREEYSLKGRRLIPSIDMRLARRMVRDNFFRGHDPSMTLSMWSKVCDGEIKYIKAYKHEANYLLDTSHSYEPCVMLPFLEAIDISNIENPDHANLFEALRERYRLFTMIEKSMVPDDSMLNEFIGV